MRSMNEEDAVYAALLTQLFSDPSTSVHDDRVHCWIQHQYDFAVKENRIDGSYASDPRIPSPSPSSSVGAHRSFDFDHPNVSPHLLSLSTAPTSSNDITLFDPVSPSYIPYEGERHRELNHTHSVGSLKQGMTHLKMQSTPPSFCSMLEKDLPALPPSPVSPLKWKSLRVLRSRSSPGQVTRSPSFSGALSSDQTQIHNIDTPPPVPVAHSLSGIDSRNGGGSFLRKLLRLQDGEDSPHALPTVSDFSVAYSRETRLTTPCVSAPASPSSPMFISSPHVRAENVPLPSSPLDGKGFFKEQVLDIGRTRTRSSLSSPVSSKTLPYPSPVAITNSDHENKQNYTAECSQSRWSVSSEGDKRHQIKWRKRRTRLLSLLTSLRLSAVWRKTEKLSATVVDMERDEEQHEKEGVVDEGSWLRKAPLTTIRTSFSLSRTSLGSSRPSLRSKTNDRPSTSLPTSPIQTSHRTSRPSLTDRCTTPLSKKSSFSSLRASCSLSPTSFSSPASTAEPAPPLPKPFGHGKMPFRASQSSLTDGAIPTLRQKKSLSSVGESVTLPRSPPLPHSPLQASFSTTRFSFTDEGFTLDAIPKVSLPKAPSRNAHINIVSLSPPHSPSRLNSPSQVLFSGRMASSASTSHTTPPPSISSHSVPGTSSIPPPSKRMSLASAAGIERLVPTSMPGCETRSASKPILRLTAKPCSLGMSALSPPHADVPGNTDLYSYSPTGSSVPQSPTKFTPLAKLASVLKTRSEILASAVPSSMSASIAAEPAAPHEAAPHDLSCKQPLPPADDAEAVSRRSSEQYNNCQLQLRGNMLTI